MLSCASQPRGASSLIRPRSHGGHIRPYSNTANSTPSLTPLHVARSSKKDHYKSSLDKDDASRSSFPVGNLTPKDAIRPDAYSREDMLWYRQQQMWDRELNRWDEERKAWSKREAALLEEIEALRGQLRDLMEVQRYQHPGAAGAAQAQASAAPAAAAPPMQAAPGSRSEAAGSHSDSQSNASNNPSSNSAMDQVLAAMRSVDSRFPLTQQPSTTAPPASETPYGADSVASTWHELFDKSVATSNPPTLPTSAQNIAAALTDVERTDVLEDLFGQPSGASPTIQQPASAQAPPHGASPAIQQPAGAQAPLPAPEDAAADGSSSAGGTTPAAAPSVTWPPPILSSGKAAASPSTCITTTAHAFITVKFENHTDFQRTVFLEGYRVPATYCIAPQQMSVQFRRRKP